jgi:hypothetical protein
MPFTKVENGYSFCKEQLQNNHIDLRLNPKIHSNARNNIHDRTTNKRNVLPAYYEDNLVCLTCGEIKPKEMSVAKPFEGMFKNYSVMEPDRKHIGLNIHCRDCQIRQYQYGYLIEDEFIAEEEEEEENTIIQKQIQQARKFGRSYRITGRRESR